MQRSLNVSELQQYTIVYCCTNCDKSTPFENVLKVDNGEKWCGSAGRLFHGSTTLLLKKILYTSTRVYTGNSLYQISKKVKASHTRYRALIRC